MKTEITDEIVDRYYKAAVHIDFSPSLEAEVKAEIRKNLEAALNPPQEPEIVVTWQMKRAGSAIKVMVFRNLESGDTTTLSETDAEQIYRAMRRLEPTMQPHEHKWVSECGGSSSTGESWRADGCGCGEKRTVRWHGVPR